MAIDTVIHTNQHSIDRVLKAGLPVALVFWRRDTPSSTQMDAVLDRLAADYAGKLLVAKVDAAAEKPLVARYRIQTLPTVVFTRSGQEEEQGAGVLSEAQLRAWFDYLVKGGARPAKPAGQSASTASTPPPSRQPHANGASSRTPGADRAPDDGKPVTLTDASFQQIIGGPGPVLVDFWAAWCGPCRMVAPAMEQLAQEFRGRAVIGKLNVDENPQTAQRYQIMSIPALYIFKDGRVVDQLMGAQPVHVLRQRLEQHL